MAGMAHSFLEGGSEHGQPSLVPSVLPGLQGEDGGHHLQVEGAPGQGGRAEGSHEEI